jgi:probable rRNA maturation factor
MDLDILIEDARWDDVGLDRLAVPAMRAALLRLGLEPDGVEISLLGCDDARIASLNADFRGKTAPTNVLSWPEIDLSPDTEGGDPAAPQPGPDGMLSLGDIAIAYETCARESAEAGKPLQDHVTHLLVHGVLHLLGYDHVRDRDATRMEGLESEILGKLGLDDPYMTSQGFG